MTRAFLNQNRACLLAVAIFPMVICCTPAHAAKGDGNAGNQTVTVSASPTVTLTKAGLSGFYYSVSTTGQNTGKYDITSLTTADNWINTNAATGTFTSTQAVLTTTTNYQADGGYGGPTTLDDTNTIKQFLGNDSSSYVGPNDLVGTTILQLQGYIDVTSLGAGNTLTINMGSNDGSYLTIGGVGVVTNLDQNNTTSAAQYESSVVTFSHGIGLYAFDLTYWNQEYTGGGTPNQGTGDYLALTITGGAANFVQTVPEPGPIAAFAVGGALMGVMLVRRRLAPGLRSLSF